ncbi:MAG: T9SS type A sorting domain-containing protein [Chitinophagales bacterium]|nr:T9SS type A sorting domain-containing protein [Chitinophagales bacterium]
MKKLYSFSAPKILVVLSCLFLAGQPLRAQSCTGNLLTNSGFEADLTDWINWGSVSISGLVHSGAKAAYVPPGIESGGSYELMGVAGNTYQLSAWAKTTSPATWSSIELSFYDAGWNTIEYREARVTSTSYQQYTINAVAPQGTVWIAVRFWKEAPGGFFADDFCLTTAAAGVSLSLGNRLYFDQNGNGRFDGNDWGIDGEVIVSLYADNNNDGSADGPAIASTTPANGGYYNFTGLAAGSYFIQVENTPSWMFLSPVNGGDPDNNIDNDNNGISHNTTTGIIKGGTITLSSGDEPGALNYNSTYDIGVFKFNGLGDYVWLDNNANGVQEPAEPGLQGVTVNLINPATNAVLQSTTTDAAGYYFFNDPVGAFGMTTYTVEFITPAGYKPTTENSGGNDELDSDPVAGRIVNVDIPIGTWNNSIDAGFVPDFVVLPVQLTSFTAMAGKNKTVNLAWTTEQEEQLNYFSIERSTDGIHFESIGIVFSAKPAGSRGRYTFTDQVNMLQTPVISYRLRSVDNNASVQLSAIRQVRFEAETIRLVISVFPNPASGEIRTRIPQVLENQPVSVDIIAMNGQVVRRQYLAVAPQLIMTDISSLQRGIYTVRVSGAGQTATQRVIKN